MTHKITHQIYTKQDDELYIAYLVEIAQIYLAKQIVTIDESTTNERTQDRKYS